MKLLNDILALQVADDITSETAMVLVNGLVKKRNLSSLYLKSVTIQAPTVFTINQAIANAASPTLTFSLANQTQKTVFAAPLAANGTPSFRALTLADISDYTVGSFISNSTTLQNGNFNISGVGRVGSIIPTNLTDGYLPKDTTNGLVNSQIFDNGTHVIIGATTPNGSSKFQVTGSIYGSTLIGTDALLKVVSGVLTRATSADIASLLDVGASANYIQNQNTLAQMGTLRLSGAILGSSIRAQNSANDVGGVSMINGTAANTGYIEFRLNTGIRLGFIGYSSSLMSYNAENGANHFFGGGSVGIGTTGLNGHSLRNSKSITGGASGFSYGNYSDGIIQSDVTGAAWYYRTQASIQAAIFTLPSLLHFHAAQGTFGAGSTISVQTAYYADATLIGATINYGFRGAIPSGANRWNTYMDGTADNYFNGNVLFGGNISAGSYKLQVFGQSYFRNTTTNGEIARFVDVSEGSYIAIQNWGFSANRGTSYFRPTTDNDKTLVFGSTDATFRWSNLYLGTTGIILPNHLDFKLLKTSASGIIQQATGVDVATILGTSAAGNYILNNTSLQANSSFNISGVGKFGGNVTIQSSNYVELLIDQTDSCSVAHGVTSATNRAFVNIINTGVGHITGNSAYLFMFNGVEKSRFDSNGNLGIGTTSPASQLHLSQDAPILSVTATNLSSGLRINIVGQTIGIAFRVQSAGTTLLQQNINGRLLLGYTAEANSYKMQIDSGTTTGQGLYVSGNIQATGNIIADGYFSGTSSDMRLKSKFGKISVIDKIDDIQVFSYRHKYHDGRLIGSSAQQLVLHFPELISKDSKGYLRVNDYGYAALGLQLGKEIIQEMRKKHNDTLTKLDVLSNEVEQLRKEVKNLKAA